MAVIGVAVGSYHGDDLIVSVVMAFLLFIVGYFGFSMVGMKYIYKSYFLLKKVTNNNIPKVDEPKSNMPDIPTETLIELMLENKFTEKEITSLQQQAKRKDVTLIFLITSLEEKFKKISLALIFYIILIATVSYNPDNLTASILLFCGSLFPMLAVYYLLVFKHFYKSHSLLNKITS